MHYLFKKARITTEKDDDISGNVEMWKLMIMQLLNYVRYDMFQRKWDFMNTTEV